MKKTRIILSSLLAMSMVFTLLVVNASATPPTDNTALSAVELAYMDTATASPEMKEAIIAARREIVYGDQAWTVDGALSIIHADGTEEKLPEFSSLWPDWDLDEISGLTPDTFEYAGNMARHSVLFDDNVQLEPQSGAKNAPTFYRFNANGKIIYAWAHSIDRDYKCNIGFNDEDQGKDLGWFPGYAAGEQAKLSTREGVRYGVRASVAAKSKANARMIVSDDPDYEPILQG